MRLLTPATCRAARGLLDWTQDRLARMAAVSRSTIRDFEKGRHDLQRATEEQVVSALERAGVVLIPAEGEDGPGLRLARRPAEGERPGAARTDKAVAARGPIR